MLPSFGRTCFTDFTPDFTDFTPDFTTLPIFAPNELFERTFWAVQVQGSETHCKTDIGEGKKMWFSDTNC